VKGEAHSEGPAVEIVTRSAAETESLGERLGGLLSGGELVCLIGELGTGKTVFVRGLARGLGCPLDEVASPTYVLERVYQGKRLARQSSGGLALRHLDAYRLRGPEEFEEADLVRQLSAPGMVAALEWADRVEGALPAERLEVRLGSLGESERRLIVMACGRRYQELLLQLARQVIS